MTEKTMPDQRKNQYVHGYEEREKERLHDQADTVRDVIHHDTLYAAGSLVLEAGCGVGAQTVTLAANSPEARFVCVDVSAESLEAAQALVKAHNLTNVEFHQANLFDLPFPDAHFDHVFVCYVLEHLKEPAVALRHLRRVLKPGGSVTAIEGDHGSCYWSPETEASQTAWRCLIDIQAELGGDSLIGRRLYPVLTSAGLREVNVSPRMFYMDQSNPGLMDGFVRKTIIPMVEGVKEQALGRGMIDEATWAQGIADLHAVADREEGTFCYTFFKAWGYE